MKIKELIEKLKTFDENAEVILECTYDYGFGTAGGNVTDIYEFDGCVNICCDEC